MVKFNKKTIRHIVDVVAESQTTKDRIEFIKKQNPGRFKMSEKLSIELGDTFLNYHCDSPTQQWFRILSMLKDKFILIPHERRNKYYYGDK